jgi:prolyl-tRNA synthetase
VVVKSELLSYYDIPGLYVLRPSAFALWEAIQRWFDSKIKSVGVENCMFPLFITKDVLEQEKEHVEVLCCLFYTSVLCVILVVSFRCPCSFCIM